MGTITFSYAMPRLMLATMIGKCLGARVTVVGEYLGGNPTCTASSKVMIIGMVSLFKWPPNKRFNPTCAAAGFGTKATVTRAAHAG